MTQLHLQDALPNTSFQLDGHADDWREAIRLAGQRLTSSGFATIAYTDEMIAAVEQHGPYMVIAPGLALAHSRPSPAVLKTGMSWVRLVSPVEFGHAQNDPVSLVIGLAAVDETEHIDVLAMLSRSLGDQSKRAALDNAQSPAEIRSLLTN